MDNTCTLSIQLELAKIVKVFSSHLFNALQYNEYLAMVGMPGLTVSLMHANNISGGTTGMAVLHRLSPNGDGYALSVTCASIRLRPFWISSLQSVWRYFWWMTRIWSPSVKWRERTFLCGIRTVTRRPSFQSAHEMCSCVPWRISSERISGQYLYMYIVKPI